MNVLHELQYAEDIKEGRVNGFDAKIVNGVEVNPKGKYPYATYAYGCGASLVAPNVLLCAAHCQGITKVRIGCHNVNQTDGDGCETHQVEEEIPHPQYNSETMDNDFMMLKLKTKSIHSPVALHSGPVNAGEDLVVMGWGTTSSGGSVSNVLLQTEVDALSNAECNNKYDGGITDSMLCASRSNGSTHYDSCQGDSGGPIIMKSTGKQVGVVSWGTGCADPRYPGVYARVSKQLPWIQSYIQKWSGGSSGGGPAPAPSPGGGGGGTGASSCKDKPGFMDAYGDGCSYYDEDTNECGVYGDEANDNGVTPNQACCACGGGSSTGPVPAPTPTPPPPSPPSPPSCDPPGWVDEDDFGCDWYTDEAPWGCDEYGNTPGSNNLTANQACCACKN
jgi:trypsin